MNHRAGNPPRLPARAGGKARAAAGRFRAVRRLPRLPLLLAMLAQASQAATGEAVSAPIRLDTRNQGSYERLSNPIALSTVTAVPPGTDYTPASLVALRLDLVLVDTALWLVFSDRLCHLDTLGGPPLPGTYGYTPGEPNRGRIEAVMADGQLWRIELRFREAAAGTATWQVDGSEADGYFLLSGPVADRDFDGLDDTLEQLLAEANPHDSIRTIDDFRPEDDFDGDGESNADEIAGGSDPADAASTVQPANAFADYTLGFVRHVEQRQDGFRELGFSLLATVGAPPGKSIFQAAVSFPEADAGLPLTVRDSGAAAEYRGPTVPGSGTGSVYPSGTYRLEVALGSPPETAPWLRLKAFRSPSRAAADYPAPLHVVSHPPFAGKLAADPVFELNIPRRRSAAVFDDYTDSEIARFPAADPPGTTLAMPPGLLQNQGLHRLELLDIDSASRYAGTATRYWFATGLAMLPDGWVFLAPPGGGFETTLGDILFGDDRYARPAWRQISAGTIEQLPASSPLDARTPVWVWIIRPLLYLDLLGDSLATGGQIPLTPGWNAVCIPAAADAAFYSGLLDQPAVGAAWQWNPDMQKLVPPAAPSPPAARALWLHSSQGGALLLP